MLSLTAAMVLEACPRGTSFFASPRPDVVLPSGDGGVAPGLDASTPGDGPSPGPSEGGLPDRGAEASMEFDAQTPPDASETGVARDVVEAATPDLGTNDCPGGRGLRCAGVCVDAQTDPGHCGDCATACPTGVACVQGVCAADCIPGLTRCISGCSFTQTDPANCGVCGNACPEGQVCSGSGCEERCTEGFSLCRLAGVGGVVRELCANLSADPLNCGACGNTCRGGAGCVAGMCRP